MEFLWQGVLSITWQQLVMYVVGGLLIWLAIEKGFEPALLMPMGFGAILVNLPLSGVINQFSPGVGETHGIIEWLFDVGIEASEAMPILLFIGIGAMIDFGPLLSNPKLFLCGAAAQAGIFLTIIIAAALGFDLKDAASIGIIGAIGHKNDLRVRIYGEKGSILWEQENCEKVTMVQYDGTFVDLFRGTAGIEDFAAGYGRLPSGHTEGWLESMGNLYKSFITCVNAKKDGTFTPDMVDFPTVHDGAEGVKFVHACLKSNAEGNVWVDL